MILHKNASVVYIFIDWLIIFTLMSNTRKVTKLLVIFLEYAYFFFIFQYVVPVKRNQILAFGKNNYSHDNNNFQ